ncbi:protein PLASTID REDOX INSENSITIVE 2, chloroplastic-like [Salvia divinorum]|uniref:Protein PLASTID REDOX INSENSITIVE 2, chloroplastic-like n=1 Tax=Salvia divinorum TaxID=28513 RepID=A0ABD1G6J8_SALDI
MASICNLPFIPPSSFPAIKPVSACAAILRHTPVFIRTPPHFIAPRKTHSVIRKAIQSQIHKNYVYPDPIPEFAAAETEKFKAELLKKLSKQRETFGNDLRMVVDVCAEIFGEFLHKDYGGPGTLLIEPFTDMMLALKDRNLAGAALAAGASLLWSQNYVDRDWEDWNSKQHK